VSARELEALVRLKNKHFVAGKCFFGCLRNSALEDAGVQMEQQLPASDKPPVLKATADADQPTLKAQGTGCLVLVEPPDRPIASLLPVYHPS